MLDRLKISKTKPSERSLDYEFLRKEGLKYIEQLSSKIWTDYNIHDPGITLLELLCYAITDLGYRTSFPIQDILSGGEDSRQEDNGQFPSAVRILPTKPVTINDYRKLLIDIKGIRNAWLRPHTGTTYYVSCAESRLSFSPQGTSYKEVQLKGLYEVIIDVDIEECIDSDRDGDSVIGEAWSRLYTNRNLCEDFVDIKIIERQEFIICAEIELEPDADIEMVQARIFNGVQKYLNPPIRFYTLKEMLDKGKTPDEIFNGPVLEQGFIDDDELEKAYLREEIHLSDIIKIAMAVEGVQAVRDIKIASLDDENSSNETKWVVTVNKGYSPVLNTEKSRIVFYKDHLPFRADASKVCLLMEEFLKKEKGIIHELEDIQIPIGRSRNIQEYYSFQNLFPRNYGIGENGLPESATIRRKAQAKQLKAYLLFFDQLLANYLAQLAHVRRLFSIEEIDKTYFTQVIKDLKGVEELYVDYANLESAIQKLVEDEKLFIKRRNRFLDHLIARFAESFSEYAWIMYSLTHDRSRRDLIRAKMDFLKEYPVLSGRRGQSFDYSDRENLWNTYNVSGLEHRVAKLLGIRDYRRRNLYNMQYEIYQEKDRDGVDEYRFKVLDNSNKILLSSSTSYRAYEDAIREMRRAIRFGMNREAYEVKRTSDGRFYFNIVDENKKVLARRIEYFRSEQDCETAIRYVIDFLTERYSDEGFFVVEHILLRPKDTEDAFLPICINADCSRESDVDPYSFRISIILPAWSARFSDPDFRRFVEKTLRLETPAHILPRICWVNEEQMARFENAYRNWLEHNISYDEERSKNQKMLVDILSELKSIYPEATLHECTDDTGKNPFLLDKTKLGTKKE